MINSLFLDTNSRRYLTGFASTDGAVTVTERGTALFLDFRYIEAARTSGEVYDGVEIIFAEAGIYSAVASYLSGNGIAEIAVDSSYITLAQYQLLQERLAPVRIIHAKDILKDLREIKNENELNCIKRAQLITDGAFAHILNSICADVTETEIAAELEYYMKKNGADGVAFETIAVSGKKSALPHGTPSDVKLTKNAFFTMDFGAKYHGYCSDMTRTVVLGKASDEMKKIYATVLEAQKRALDTVKDKVRCSAVDKAAREYIYKCGYKGKFGHSTGHSLGLEIHEAPHFSEKSPELLKAGTVMTVEPGIYIEGFGGVRIEDMVYVTSNGCVNLTHSPKELIEL